MLQTVVTQNHIALRVRLQCRACSLRPVPAYPHRTNIAPCHQQRFVAHLQRIACSADLLRQFRLAAETATDYQRMPSVFDQLLCQGSVRGVLPVPPTLMLPATMTGSSN